MLESVYNNKMSVIHIASPSSNGRSLCGWRIRQDKLPNRKAVKSHKKCKKCQALKANYVGGQE